MYKLRFMNGIKSRIPNIRTQIPFSFRYVDWQVHMVLMQLAPPSQKVPGEQYAPTEAIGPAT